MQDFDATIARFRSKELKVENWNFCMSKDGDSYVAYVMGEGAEQCLAAKHGFATRQEIIDLFKSLGAKSILPI